MNSQKSCNVLIVFLLITTISFSLAAPVKFTRKANIAKQEFNTGQANNTRQENHATQANNNTPANNTRQPNNNTPASNTRQANNNTPANNTRQPNNNTPASNTRQANNNTPANNTRQAKISNYEPGQSNEKQQARTYSVPLKGSNKNKTLYKGQKRIDNDQNFLNSHNVVRQRYGLPPLVWDGKLADYASTYASNRRNDCDMLHSNGKYGENIFWGSGFIWTTSDIIKLWVREHQFYNRQTKSCATGQMCGHYTQIVWRNSRRLGCSKIQCHDGNTFAICNYDPPGNFKGEGPFDAKN